MIFYLFYMQNFKFSSTAVSWVAFWSVLLTQKWKVVESSPAGVNKFSDHKYS